MRKVEGTATISIEELDRLREREQWYNDLRGKLKNIVGKLDTEEYDKEMKKIDDSPDDISDEELDALIKQAAGTVKIILNGEIIRKLIIEFIDDTKSEVHYAISEMSTEELKEIPLIIGGRHMIQILELFGGIGSPRCALRNLNIPTKAIDYVEINEKAVRSYNSMFREELAYKTQTVAGWNLKPDILIHGSPCQDMSIAGHQGKATGEGRINRGKGSDEGSGTRSSLMWETIHIIENMGEWRPRYVIWENVKNVKSKYMRPNFDRYMVEMERLGYTNNFEVLDAREFGLPQARERVFTVSVLNGERFEFDDLIRTPMRNLQEFLEDDASVPDVYDVTQPSVLACIGEKGIRRATVITDCAYTITTRQDRTPAQVIDRGDGRYRYLTERECWRLMGYTDEDFDRAKAVQQRNGKYYKALYDQAGNSIAVPIFESIFRKIILHEVA